MQDIVRDILSKCTQIDVAALSHTDDLFDAGMNSFASVQVMMALEERFDIEFPDELMRRETFRTIGAIVHHVEIIEAR